MNPETAAVYSSEALLKDIGPDEVTFILDGDYQQHPFAEGRPQEINGSRYLLVAIEIADDEQPIDNARRKEYLSTLTKPHRTVAEEKAIRRSVMACKGENFQMWVYKRLSEMTVDEKKALLTTSVPQYLCSKGLGEILKHGEYAEEWCKYYIYYRCQISSRKELGQHNKKKNRELFGEMLHEFRQWSGGY